MGTDLSRASDVTCDRCIKSEPGTVCTARAMRTQCEEESIIYRESSLSQCERCNVLLEAEESLNHLDELIDLVPTFKNASPDDLRTLGFGFSSHLVPPWVEQIACDELKPGCEAVFCNSFS